MATTVSHVGIIGLGLIGGSLARDLVGRGIAVTAHDREASRLRTLDDPMLRRVQFVDRAAGVLAAPIAVIAVPVEAALAVLEELAPHVTDDHVVLDVGSTKQAIVAHGAALGIAPRFVGCHPLAGDHRAGWEASRAGLFHGARVFVCPSSLTAVRTTRVACDLWRAVGARPEAEPAESHDARMALVSHMPHLLSAALALTLRDGGLARSSLGPGGRDVTRLAGGSPESWAGIARQNRRYVFDALLAAEQSLRQLREFVGNEDDDSLLARLRQAREWCAADE